MSNDRSQVSSSTVVLYFSLVILCTAGINYDCNQSWLSWLPQVVSLPAQMLHVTRTIWICERSMVSHPLSPKLTLLLLPCNCNIRQNKFFLIYFCDHSHHIVIPLSLWFLFLDSLVSSKTTSPSAQNLDQHLVTCGYHGSLVLGTLEVAVNLSNAFLQALS